MRQFELQNVLELGAKVQFLLHSFCHVSHYYYLGTLGWNWVHRFVPQFQGKILIVSISALLVFVHAFLYNGVYYHSNVQMLFIKFISHHNCSEIIHFSRSNFGAYVRGTLKISELWLFISYGMKTTNIERISTTFPR